MVTQHKNGDSTESAKRNPYPYYSFSKAVEVADVVRANGGSNSEVPKSLIAQHLGVDENSPTLIQTIGAAKTFGLIDGRGTYALTERAKRYFFPTGPHERQQASLEMLKMPTAYESLINRFDGQQLPAAENLANILHRDFKVSETWRPRVVSLFLSSLREAGVLDAGGFLRYKASLHRSNAGTVNPMKDSTMTAERPPEHAPAPSREDESKAESRPQSLDVDVWSFRIGDESVRLETSHELSMAAWAKLNRCVQALKPEG